MKQPIFIISLLAAIGSLNSIYSSAPAAQASEQNPHKEFVKSLYIGLWKKFKPVFNSIPLQDAYIWDDGISFDRLNNEYIPERLNLLEFSNSSLNYAQELKRFKPDYIVFKTQLVRGTDIEEVMANCLKKYPEPACRNSLCYEWRDIPKKKYCWCFTDTDINNPYETRVDYMIHEAEDRAQTWRERAESLGSRIDFYKKIQPLHDWVVLQTQQYIRKMHPDKNDLRTMKEDLEERINRYRWRKELGADVESKRNERDILALEIIKNVIDGQIRQYEMKKVVKKYLPHPGIAEIVAGYEYDIPEEKEAAANKEAVSSVPGGSQ